MSVQYFYDPGLFEWTKTLRSYYNQIRHEWEKCPGYLKKPRCYLQKGPTLEVNNSKWDLIVLMDRDKPNWELQSFFPITMSLLDQINIYENLAFSIFYPGTEIKPHKGHSKDILRVHLAIDTNDQAALVCGNQSRSLKNGEVLIFEDGEEHFAYNRSNRIRTILMFDVLKTSVLDSFKLKDQ